MRLQSCFFFFNDTATTEIYTLSLHDALPIFGIRMALGARSRDVLRLVLGGALKMTGAGVAIGHRSEEHTSELQSPCNLVCRLLLEKKKYLRIQTSSTRESVISVMVVSLGTAV